MELEALRLSLTTAHTSQLETSQANVQQEQESAVEELQAAMREKFTQESALLQARYQSGLDSFKQQNQQQQDRLQELHQQEIGEYKQTVAALCGYVCSMIYFFVNKFYSLCICECLDELKKRFETHFAQERAGLEEKQIKEIQVELVFVFLILFYT